MTGDPFGAVAGRGGDRIDGEREHNDGEFHLVARPKARRQTELNASSLGRDGCAIVARGGERLYGLVRPGLGLRPRVASSSFAVRCHRSGAPAVHDVIRGKRPDDPKEFLAETVSGSRAVPEDFSGCA